MRESRAHLRLHGDGSTALGAGLGAELGVAANTNGLSLDAYVPLPCEILAAVGALGAVGHRHAEVDSPAAERAQNKEDVQNYKQAC